MRDEYIYYVYMTQSASRRALYIGVTNNLRKRVWQHKNHIYEGFSDDYNCTRLVYWESFDDVANAIDREEQLKRSGFRWSWLALGFKGTGRSGCL
jgi:putative endonuclease